MKSYLKAAFAAACFVGLVGSMSMSYRIFDGNDCSGSGGNCTEDVIVTKSNVSQMGALADLDASLSSSNGTTFFASEKWKVVFPLLQRYPRILKNFQSGMQIVRIDKADGSRFYIATKLSKELLLRNIAVNKPGVQVAGAEGCMHVFIR